MSDALYIYSRNVTNTDDLSLQFQSAFSHLFRHMVETHNQDAPFSRRILDHNGGFFFAREDLLRLFYSKTDVQSDYTRERYVNHHGAYYDLQKPDPKAQAFLNTLPEELKESFVYMIERALEYQKGINRAAIDPEVFKKHMLRISEAYDLVDPRLMTYEETYQTNKSSTPGSYNPSALREKTTEFMLTSEASSRQVLCVLTLKEELQKALRAINAADDKKDFYEELSAHSKRAAKTFLYSQVISRLQDKLPTEQERDTFREMLFESMEDAPDAKTAASILESKINNLYGFDTSRISGRVKKFCSSANKIPESAQDIIKQAMPIAEGFGDIYSSFWALAKAKEIETYSDAITKEVNSTLDLTKGKLELHDTGALTFTKAFDAIRLDTLKTLSLEASLTEEQLPFVNQFLKGSINRKRQTTISDANRVKVEISLQKHFKEAGMEADDFTPESKAFLGDEKSVFSFLTDDKERKTFGTDILRAYVAAATQSQAQDAVILQDTIQKEQEPVYRA